MLTTIIPIYSTRGIKRRRSGVRCRNKGFTLVELLIALLLGALVIGGVATVFVSSQQTYLRLTEYNNAQEAFRYASHAITRVTRGADGVAPSGDNSLVLRLRPPGEGGGTNQNCLGLPVTVPEFNRFCISPDGDLVCEVSDNPIPPGSACPALPVLLQGVDILNFSYATFGPNSYEPNYQSAASVANWLGGGGTICPEEGDEGVTGVRVQIGMTEGFQITFTASVRQKLVPCDVEILFGG